MLRWLRKRILRWKRERTPQCPGLDLAASTGILTLAACHPSGPELSPRLRTVFRAGRFYDDMQDVEIRGLPGGRVRYIRNVATQYHVRVGCESTGHKRGTYEVMRLLHRWNLAALPEGASVESARLVLRQEDTTSFPHFSPLRWPTTFYLYPVKKPWHPGRGGVDGDNLSRPEPGDVWWLEAKAGELSWHEPGCGYGSDQDPEADRGEQPLASARLCSPQDDLVFTGPRLATHVEEALASDKTLNLLITASQEDELLHGSVKCFFSRESGEDNNPESRPRLELEWRARALWAESHPFVIEPGTSCIVRPSSCPSHVDAVTLCASMSLSDPEDSRPCLEPEVYALDWRRPGDNGRESGALQKPLTLPSWGSIGEDFRVCLSTAVRPVEAGGEFVANLHQTWIPSAGEPEALIVEFTFAAPSGRMFKQAARHRGEHRYECRFRPDELGLWSYSWSTQPDERFPAQRGTGYFTTVRGPAAPHRQVLETLATATLEDVRHARSIVDRRRCHHRLTAWKREIHNFQLDELRRGAPREVIDELEALLERVVEATRGLQG